MDYIPNEILFSIFNHLGVRSLMNCRMVCKRLVLEIQCKLICRISPCIVCELRCFRWKCCADGSKPKRLVVRDSTYNVTKWWHYTYRPVDDDDVIQRFEYFVHCSSIFDLNLLNIKQITYLIIDTPLVYMDVGILNRLQQLKHLEFINFIYQCTLPPQLVLPRLERLKINSASYHHDGTAIYAPKLEILSCLYGLSGVQILCPDSVKHLEIGDAQANLKNFKNVEIFSCFGPESIVADIYEQLPKLKEIHLIDGHYKDILRTKILSFEETAIAMNRLLEQKKSLGKNDLKLHFLGEPMDDHNKMFEDYGFHRKFERIFKV